MGSRQASGLRAGSRTSIPGKGSLLNYSDKILYIIDHHLDIKNFFTFIRKNLRIINISSETYLVLST